MYFLQIIFMFEKWHLAIQESLITVKSHFHQWSRGEQI